MRVLIRNTVFTLMLTAIAFGFSGCSVVSDTVNYFKGAVSTEKPMQELPGQASEITENAITVGIVELDTYNPLVSKSPTMKNMLGFMFEPLFVCDDKTDAVGVLASGYQTSPDGKSLRVTLKNNVVWHDDAPFTSADVVYTSNVILNGQTLYTELLKDVVSVTALDGYTLTFVFNRPIPNAAALLSFPIIKNGAFTESFKPTGTGPFYLDYDRLTAFGSYHGNKPKLDYINVKSIPDKEKFLSLFNASVIDIADSSMVDMNEYMPRSNAQVYNYFLNNMLFVGFNTQDEVFGFKEARRSVSALIDRQKIASHVYFSRAEAVNYPLNPQLSVYPDTKGRLDSDAGTAEKLLKDAKWKKDKRGVYYYADNNSMTYFTVEILVNSDDKERLKAAAEISDAMTEMGLRNKVTSCPENEFTARISSGNFDMFVGEISLSPNNDLYDLLSGGNILKYSDTQTDILLLQIGTLTAEEDKTAVYAQLMNRIKDECPIAPICFLKESFITSAKLKAGITPTVSGVIQGTENWSVK